VRAFSLSAPHGAPALRWGSFHGKDKPSVRRDYELTFILRIDSNEDVTNEMVDEVKGWVEADGLGAVNKVDRWGRRRMAYEIDKQREGYYVLFDAAIDSKNIPELERNLTLTTGVLRYLLVRKDE
jgi:small subunit ribosomal protein S6